MTTEAQQTIDLVIKYCKAVLHKLRFKAEEEWSSEDHGNFYLAGSILFLHEHENDETPFTTEMNQTLKMSVQASANVIKQYQRVSESERNEDEDVLLAMCSTLLVLYTNRVKKFKSLENSTT